MSWNEFLPPNAILMRRRGPAPGDASARADSANNPSRTSSTPAATDPLAQLASDLQAGGGCGECKLAKTRQHVVVGEGNPNARLLFLGEGPDEQEDLAGRPSVGPAGELLDKMIVAMGLKREDVYIANVVKCRAPDNREPEPDEVLACSKFLFRQIESIQPDVVVSLGAFASQTLLQVTTPITQLRGTFHDFALQSGKPVRLMPTLHPAYLLRNPEAKRDAWEDLKQVAKALALTLPKK
jgi:DNA polymerase